MTYLTGKLPDARNPIFWGLCPHASMGTLSPDPLTRTLPLDPAGGLLSLRPLLCPQPCRTDRRLWWCGHCN